jgi:hypothetical protein
MVEVLQILLRGVIRLLRVRTFDALTVVMDIFFFSWGYSFDSQHLIYCISDCVLPSPAIGMRKDVPLPVCLWRLELSLSRLWNHSHIPFIGCNHFLRGMCVIKNEQLCTVSKIDSDFPVIFCGSFIKKFDLGYMLSTCRSGTGNLFEELSIFCYYVQEKDCTQISPNFWHTK